MTETTLVLRSAGPDTVSVCGVFCKSTNQNQSRPYFACPFYAQDVDFHLPRTLLDSHNSRRLIGDAIRRETELRQNEYCKFPKVPVLWYWVYEREVTAAYSVHGDYLGYVTKSPSRVLWRQDPGEALSATPDTIRKLGFKLVAEG